jgi:anhydro-N-acetylmuramic acid kinase
MEKAASANFYNIIGIMSGTSLDGVDLAHCTFVAEGDTFRYTLNVCETIPYPDEWLNRLVLLPASTAIGYASTHVAYGKLLGQLVKDFALRNRLSADYVASHGHTIFHQPLSGYTSQIGEGAALASTCGIPVICDFRTGDVAYGGQGAPLVPLGDELLFAEYGYCLNLGGFANISYTVGNRRIAFDVCPVNFALNHFAGLAGQRFDRDGILAASGKIDSVLLERLNALSYYHTSPPKSLGREWVEKEFIPLLECPPRLNDLMRTLVEHIAIQVGQCLSPDCRNSMLVTGGGTYNLFLMERIKACASVAVHIPDKRTIDYKEALIFAFLGLLRVMGKPNCLASVTGASKNACGGAIYLP